MKRNYGIDLLRIVSMCLIVTIHILLQGGMSHSVDKGSFVYGYLVFCQAIAYCCVDCYALISGYVGVKSDYKYYKTVLLWLQVLFYSLLITVLFSLFSAEPVTKKDWLTACFPITKRAYWYATAYVALSLFFPFLNKMLLVLSKKQLVALAATVLLLFSVVQILAGKEIFITNKGYSLLWLAALYLVGGAVRLLRLDEIIGRVKGAAMTVAGIVLSFISEYIPTAVQNKKSGLLGSYNYVYFSVLLTALGMLILFSNLRLRKKAAVQCIAFLSPLSFSVYLIHAHPLIWSHLLKDRFAGLTAMPFPLMLLAMIGVIFAVYLVCSLLDLPRYQLFRRLRLAERLNAAEQKLKERLDKKSVTSNSEITK